MRSLDFVMREREGGSEGGKVFRGETGSKLCFKGIPRYEALRLWKGPVKSLMETGGR